MLATVGSTCGAGECFEPVVIAVEVDYFGAMDGPVGHGRVDGQVHENIAQGEREVDGRNMDSCAQWLKTK